MTGFSTDSTDTLARSTDGQEGQGIAAAVEAVYARHHGKAEFVAGVAMVGMGGLLTWATWNSWWPVLGIFLIIVGLTSLLVPERATQSPAEPLDQQTRHANPVAGSFRACHRTQGI